MGYKETFKEWKQFGQDEEIVAELNELETDETEVKSRFSNALSFGTAGLRSKLGAGTNRMNIYTVGQATQGLCEYVKAHGQQKSGMVIAYDTRHNSDVFAQTTACIFAANGIKTYLFREATSVPELSFAIRHLGAFGGVAITASHNPKEYNGYKVYAEWGGQLLDGASKQVIGYVSEVKGFSAVLNMELNDAIAQGMVTMLSANIDEEYYQQLLTIAKRPENIEAYARDIRFVYTPLFGTGMRTFEGVMQHLPYRGEVVESQRYPNSDFPGLNAPNPEDEHAMARAIILAKETGADIAFGTDPDADRMGAAIPNGKGEYIMISGNQVACLIIDYLLGYREESGQLLPSDFVVKSFVSTKMADDIAQHYGIECVTVPTGFKYISDTMHNRYKDRHFVFGFEESCGFMAGDFIGDKDGVMAGLLLLEVLCDCKARGESLYDRLQRLYNKYGWHKEKVVVAMLDGADGMERMERIMKNLRSDIPKSFGGQRVVRYTDYQSGIVINEKGEHTIDFPRTNALEFILEKGWLCIRPSGTEPKVRVYCGVCDIENKASENLLNILGKEAAQLLNS